MSFFWYDSTWGQFSMTECDPFSITETEKNDSFCMTENMILLV